MILFISTNALAVLLAVLSLVGNVVQGIISSNKEKAINYNNAQRDVKIANIQADAKDLHKEIDALEIELKDAKASHEKVLLENSTLRERVSKLENTIETLSSELDRKEQVIAKLKNTA